MGCHTWFYNKISDIPNSHITKLREKAAKDIKGFYLYNCSYEKWVADRDEDIAEMMRLEHLDEQDKEWLEQLKRTRTKEYFMEKLKEYDDRIKRFEDPDTPKEELLKLFSHQFVLFDADLDNGYYNLSDWGWGDNYRVSGNPYYPDEKFYSATSAINFLENYDDRLITYDMKEGMCDEIRNIINNFFNEYPHGMICYG